MSGGAGNSQWSGHGPHIGQHKYKDFKWQSTLDIKVIISVVIMA